MNNKYRTRNNELRRMIKFDVRYFVCIIGSSYWVILDSDSWLLDSILLKFPNHVPDDGFRRRIHIIGRHSLDIRLHKRIFIGKKS
jgi:hypothetical protein